MPDSANHLSGVAAGNVLQAATIGGDVHFHGANAPQVIPHQLPAAPPHFVDRVRELSLLDRVLDGDRPGLAVLTGPGGVGKTALAVQWASRVCGRFPDGQLYWELDGDEPVDPGEILGGFLRALGVQPANVPATLAERTALYRSLTASRTVLVVADNAFSAAQVRVLVPTSSTSVTVVTSRGRLPGLVGDGAYLIEVDPLPTNASVAMLAKALGAARIDSEREHAVRLAELCGGLPIALVVATARLATRPRLSVRRVVSELADEATRLAGLSTMEDVSVRATFDAVYRNLDPRAAALYRGMALHPGQEFGSGPVAAVMVTIDADTRDDSANDPLDTLVQANLLTEIGEDRFRFHDLIRLHARAKADTEETADARDRVLRAVLVWYLVAAERADVVVTPYRRRIPHGYIVDSAGLPELPDRDTALAWLDRERLNLIAAGRAALEGGYAELAWRLSDVLWPLLLLRKYHQDRLEIDRRGLAAAQAWDNVWAAADMAKRLSGGLAATGDWSGAERYARAAIEYYERAGDARGVQDARGALAHVYERSGREPEAAEILTAVLAENRVLGEARPVGLTLISLGMLLPRIGRHREAVGLLEEAAAIYARLRHIDPYNEARVASGLATAYLAAGEARRAADLAEHAASRMRALGSDAEWAAALDILGQAAAQRGDLVAARRYYRTALHTLDALGSRRASGPRARLAALDGRERTASSGTATGDLDDRVE